MSNPRFIEHLKMMAEIHERKSKDYGANEDRLINYHRQAVIADWFDHPQDRVYAARIGEKLSRLATLRNREHDADRKGQDRPEATNEPITDSFLDICTISNIWWGDYEGGYRALTSVGPNEDRSENPRQGIRPGEGGAQPDSRREVGVGTPVFTDSPSGSGGAASESELHAGQGVVFGPVSISAVQIVESISRSGLTRYELDWIEREAHVKHGKR